MIEILILLFGLFMGSFGNNLISYLSGSAAFDIYRSRCFCGEKGLTISELIPVVSFVLLRGRCKECKKKISVRYLIMELLSGTIALLCYLYYGISYMTLVHFGLLYILLIVAFVDYIKLIIPNSLVAGVVIMSIMKIVINGNPELSNVLASIFLFSFFFMLNVFYEKFRDKTAIGFGDIKLISAVALFFPLFTVFFGLWLGAVFALLFYVLLGDGNNRHAETKKIPFGFFLCFSYIILDFAGSFIEAKYLQFFFNR